MFSDKARSLAKSASSTSASWGFEVWYDGIPANSALQDFKIPTIFLSRGRAGHLYRHETVRCFQIFVLQNFMA